MFRKHVYENITGYICTLDIKLFTIFKRKTNDSFKRQNIHGLLWRSELSADIAYAPKV